MHKTFWEPNFGRVLSAGLVEVLLIVVVIWAGIEFRPPPPSAPAEPPRVEYEVDLERLQELIESGEPLSDRRDEFVRPKPAPAAEPEPPAPSGPLVGSRFYVVLIAAVSAFVLLVWLAQATRYRVYGSHVERRKLWGRRRFLFRDIARVREQSFRGGESAGDTFYYVLDHEDRTLFRFTSGMPECEEFAAAIRRAIA